MERTPAIYISPRQQRIHERTEWLSVLFVLPFTVYLATRKELPPWARVAAGALGVGILYVDLGLALTWAAKRRGEAGFLGGG